VEKNKAKLETKIQGVLGEIEFQIKTDAGCNSYGWGGITLISKLSGASQTTIKLGIKELGKGIEIASANKIRCSGAGRKREKDKQQGLEETVLELVEGHTVGDPMRIIMWTRKSARHLQEELLERGFKVSHELIRQILKQNEYIMQSNQRLQEGVNHPDRDAQFNFINEKSKRFIAENQPVISVDCKKKELTGNYKKNGKERNKVKKPTEVNVYDFIDKTKGKASPYGIYDIKNKRGWVSVGTNSDTAVFSVATMRNWRENEGKIFYPKATKLYINADVGGNNGLKNRLWESELQQFANATGLKLQISHLPSGTRKWNKIEHRLFSYISINCRGKSLRSLTVIISLINATTTKTGLKVTAKIDDTEYKTGIKISDEEFEKINIRTIQISRRMELYYSTKLSI
jgi:hypothetical protein